MKMLAVLILFFSLIPLIHAQPPPDRCSDDTRSQKFLECCRRKKLDCAETSCRYQCFKEDVHVPPVTPIEDPNGKNCFDKEHGFDAWRECFVNSTTIRPATPAVKKIDCCRNHKPKNETDLPELCLNLCDPSREDVDEKEPADYAICEEFRYRINSCNARLTPK